MKQRRYLRRFGIYACQVRTLLEISVPTGKREIVELGGPAVLAGDDVFDMKRTPESGLRNAAVFATLSGAPAHTIRAFVHA